MSAWTDAEVAELERKGNDYAKRTWLKNAPPIGSSGRPREGDDVNVFKRFVVDAYERKRYYGEDDGGVGAGMAVATAVPLSGPPPSHFTGGPPARTVPRSISRPPVSAAPVAVAPVADLLDFSSMAPATPAPPPAAAVFEADFEAFGAPAAPTPIAPAPAAPVTVVHDPFAPVSTVPAAPSAASSSGFTFISNSSAAAAPTPTISDPAPVPAIKKPVMSNQCVSEKSSFISLMNLPSGNQQASQGFCGGMMQPNIMPQQGFGGNNNMGTMQQQQQQQAFMMQQQQMRMMGMNGMSNPAMMGMGMQGGMNPMAMNGGFGNQQSMMMNGGGFGGGTNMMNGATPSNNKKGNLNSLDILDWKK